MWDIGPSFICTSQKKSETSLSWLSIRLCPWMDKSQHFAFQRKQGCVLKIDNNCWCVEFNVVFYSNTQTLAEHASSSYRWGVRLKWLYLQNWKILENFNLKLIVWHKICAELVGYRCHAYLILHRIFYAQDSYMTDSPGPDKARF